MKRRRDMFMGGITVSKLFSLAGGAANIYDASFLVDNDSLIQVPEFQVDVMYTPEPTFNVKGGLGLDLGFTFQRMMRDAGSYYPNSPKLGCNEVPYKYKLGVSIIDIGFVKFADTVYSFAGYDFNDYNWTNYDDPEIDEDNPTAIFEDAESAITQGQVKKQDRIRLPTLGSIQFDYNVWASRVYLNVSLIQGIPPGKKTFGLRHANSFSITPRYESYWIDFALPFSLYEYRYPQLGASLRLGPITVGTDKLLSWINESDLYGTDIYVYLKLPFRYNPKCKSRLKRARSNKSRGNRNPMTRCTN
ncbi:MAG: hypothetical protein JKY09_03435 [Crocinitomicaceae bacterium]|nr:hypothetical protein [Crocinitomicaceae bacterium]